MSEKIPTDYAESDECALAKQDVLSALATLKINTGINEMISYITYQLQNQPHQGKNKQRAKNHRIIALPNRFKAQSSQTIQVKNYFNQKIAGKKYSHNRRWQACNNNHHRIAKYMTV